MTTICSWKSGIFGSSIETDRNNLWVCVSTVCSRCARERVEELYMYHDGKTKKSSRYSGDVFLNSCNGSFVFQMLIMS